MSSHPASLRDALSASTKAAMKSKEALRVSTLRLISAAIKDRDIAARSEDRCDGIDDGEILSLLSKMVKQREMPQPLSDTEMKAAVAAIVEETGATCLKDMGKIMGRLKTDYAGRLDMGKAGALVKGHLCE